MGAATNTEMNERQPFGNRAHERELDNVAKSQWFKPLTRRTAEDLARPIECQLGGHRVERKWSGLKIGVGIVVDESSSNDPKVTSKPRDGSGRYAISLCRIEVPTAINCSPLMSSSQITSRAPD